MSFEAIAGCRLKGTNRDFTEKWVTVPTDCRETAIRMFHDLGYDIRGLQILTQEEANVRAERAFVTIPTGTVGVPGGHTGRLHRSVYQLEDDPATDTRRGWTDPRNHQ